MSQRVLGIDDDDDLTELLNMISMNRGTCCVMRYGRGCGTYPGHQILSHRSFLSELQGGI
jgi:hypothetical protein